VNIGIEVVKANNGYIIRVIDADNETKLYVSEDETRFKQSMGRIINDYVKRVKKSDPADSADAE
jgi:hypothetical protein